MDGWMGGWTDGWTDGFMCVCVCVCVCLFVFATTHRIVRGGRGPGKVFDPADVGLRWSSDPARA
jgi:hypothetical protein